MEVNKHIIAAILAPVFIFSITGCGKKIDPIENDDVIEALEDVLDMEKYEGYGDFPPRYYIETEDGEVYLRDFDDPRAPSVSLDVEYQLMTHTTGGSSTIEVNYIIFEDGDDAEAYYDSWYKSADNMHNKEFHHNRINGQCGYLIVKTDTFYNVVYFSDDTLLCAIARNADDFEEIEEFVDALGLPLK